MRNHDFDIYLGKNHIFGRRKGVAATVAPKGLGASKPHQKFGPLGGHFGSTVISKPVI